MPVNIPKRAAADVPAPTRIDVVEVFVDTDDLIKFKDSRGVVRTAVAVSGTPISLAKQAVAPAAEADKHKLYAKEIVDLEVVARDSAGNEIPLTNEGGPAAISAGGPVGVFWPSTNQVKVDASILAATTYEVVLPEALVPPNGVRSLYVIDVKIVSSAVEGGWGGKEIPMLLVFREIGGTPDVRMAADGCSGYGYLDGLEDGPIFPTGFLDPLGNSVDSLGVLTVKFANITSFFAGNAKITVTVAGPFVFPDIPGPA